MSFLERIYIVAVIQGVLLTFGRLLRNFTLHCAHVLGLAKATRAAATYQYPNERRPYALRYRGRHRLTLYPNGDIKCTSCFLCATACPAKCIYIEAS